MAINWLPSFLDYHHEHNSKFIMACDRLVIGPEVMKMRVYSQQPIEEVTERESERKDGLTSSMVLMPSCYLILRLKRKVFEDETSRQSMDCLAHRGMMRFSQPPSSHPLAMYDILAHFLESNSWNKEQKSEKMKLTLNHRIIRSLAKIRIMS